jgi:hypothetical protein
MNRVVRLVQFHPLQERIVWVMKQVWLAYLLASVLVLCGITWGLPDHLYQGMSFQADENAAVYAVSHISFPAFNPEWYLVGTALFYQVYLIETILGATRLVNIDNFWIVFLGRLVSYVSALGAITLVFLLGRKLFDEWTGRLAAIILAVLPGFVINSHYFKADVPVTFWILAGLLAAYELVSSGKFSYVLILGLLVGYSGAVKYSAVMLFPAGLVALAMAHRALKPIAWIAYPASVAAGFIIGEPRVFLNYSDILIGIRTVSQLLTLGIPYHVGRPPALLDYPLNVFPLALSLPMWALTAFAFVWAIVKHGKRLLPIFTFMLFYYLLLANDNDRLVRYTVPLLPFAALFVAHLVASLRQLRNIHVVAVPAMVIVVAYTFIFSLSYVQVMAQTDPRVQASVWIKENIPRDVPLPTTSTHYTNYPDLPFLGYKRLEILYSIAQLRDAESPYLIVSEFAMRFYQEAIDHYPAQQQFFDYVRANYKEVVRFENSQQILGVDSKDGIKISEDWLHPNPRITILRRQTSPN